MRNPFKQLKCMSQKIIVVVGGLMVIKVLIFPNAFDILILIGLLLVILGWFCDEFR
ncbi:MAG TPA: hypothetical protein VHY08_04740 [Bacillota bacterium]|nr:hypothetical protein [Bacillota bacterium]